MMGTRPFPKKNYSVNVHSKVTGEHIGSMSMDRASRMNSEDTRDFHDRIRKFGRYNTSDSKFVFTPGEDFAYK